MRRFLADRGVPRDERGSVLLVFAGDEIIWVVGIELGERRRLEPGTRERLCLALHHAAPAPGLQDAQRRPGDVTRAPVPDALGSR